MEWLETDGLGGFASGTVAQIAVRGYHALLVAAKSPPVHRMALVNSLDAWLEIGSAKPEIIHLTRHCFTSPDAFNGVVCPPKGARVEVFAADPWPRWTLRASETVTVENEIFLTHGAPNCVVSFRVRGVPPSTPVKLCVRPLLSGRDVHEMHHENHAFDFTAVQARHSVVFHPYGEAVPAIAMTADATYVHSPTWYRNFLYREDQARFQNCVEDLASPGIFTFDCAKGEALLVLSAITSSHHAPAEDVHAFVDQARIAETRRRKSFRTPLDRAANQYIVRRGEGSSIIAGYPWFTDWGRDTFISIRGLCLATGRLAQAESILSAWAATIDRGMIPNRFVDHGDPPEFHAIDASLWFVIAAGEFLELATLHKHTITDQKQLETAMLAIVTAYRDGTRFNIAIDQRDSLIRGGAPGFALTWMDARIGTWCVTPRIGKPIEIQALWIRALHFVSRFAPQWSKLQDAARKSVAQNYFDTALSSVHDCIDVNFESGHIDSALRANQIFALGGMGPSLFSREQTAAALTTIEQKLLTPMGLRTLAPGEKNYQERYEGNREARDFAYHQGTVWPWLLGPFVEAWVNHRGNTSAAKMEARKRFLEPLLAASKTPGAGGISIGHIAEIADGAAPHFGRGCPMQAWSLAEALRLDAMVLRI